MTSACIFIDILRNHIQIFLELRNSILRFVYISSTPTALLTSYLPLMQSSGAGTSNEIPLQESALALPAIPITLPFSFFHISYLLQQFIILISKMTLNISMASDDSNVFYVEQSSSELSSQRQIGKKRKDNTPNILSSTETSEQHTAQMPSISSIASPELRIFTIDDNSNEPTMPYGFGRQLPIVSPSLKDLNLPPNPININNTMAVKTQTQDNNEQNSPELPEASLPSPISTPPMNVSAYNSWETPHTTTDDNTFYSEDEPRRVYWTSPLGETFESEDEPRTIYVLSPSPSLQPSPPRRQKRKLSLAMSFPKEGECRSTSAKPAVRPSPQQRTSQVHQEGNKL